MKPTKEELEINENEVDETAVGVEEFHVYGKDQESIPCDEIKFDSSTGRYNFMYNDKVRAYIKANGFVYSLNRIN